MVRIDLHTHSSRSDGTSPPAEVVAHAVGAGLDVIALTDHDTAEGWGEAAAAADELGITFVPGMEVSCRLGSRGVHLLGYLPDPTHPGLARELERILEGRDGRMPQIVAKLQAIGIAIEEADVHAVSGDAAASGRPHVADALVRAGVVEARDEAFARFLGPSGPAYVRRYATPLEDMITLIREAGGVSVLAHPWGRGSRSALDADTIARLTDHGLTGLEVDHQDHDAEDRERLRAIAADLDLVVTGSSDHHGTGKVDHDLGCNTTAPDQLHRLLEAAAAAARASGRTVPTLAGPGLG